MTELLSGDVVTLVVKEKQASQYILTNDETDVRLNSSEVLEELNENDQVKVFLYADRRGDLAATTAIPHITKDTFGWARVMRVSRHDGAVIDIGTSREVIVPAEDLPVMESLWPEVGDHLYVTLRVDYNGNLFGRLVTEERVMELFEDGEPELFNQNIVARPYRLLPIGTFLLGVEKPYRIFVHQTERDAEPRFGSDVNVRIIEVKEDGTMNASMKPRVYERLTADADQIFTYLQEVGGKMPFGDKSSPDEIKDMFNMSKGSFKRALGTLMKAGRIEQVDGWTKLKD